MRVSVRRVAQAALAAILTSFATLAGAQSTESDFDDDTPNIPVEFVNAAMTQSSLIPVDATPSLPPEEPDFAFAQSPNSPIIPASSAPARFLAINHRIEVHADGSYTTYSHIELQLVSPQAVAALAQPAIGYSESLQDVQIKSAFTLKKDGTKLEVQPGGIFVRQKSVPAPYFTDLKEKVILFPNVEPGDTLSYDFVVQSQPRIPGQFYFTQYLPRGVEVDVETLTFAVPKDHPLTFDLYGIAVEKSSEGDSLVYTVRYSNRSPTLELPQFLSELDHGIRVFASNVTTYDGLATGYAPLALSKIAVTPGILAKANEITAGVSDRREQARRLYEWVSAHIRYVALLLGDGGLVPHDAESVLTNAFGDCKDHAVLYSALLKAKGIASELVIINGTNDYIVPQIPQILSFNHMIVWLPEFKLYADTTSGITPFGVLPQLEYGKPVVHVRDRGALQHTPVLAESEASFSSSTNVRLEEGRLSATNTSTASGAMTTGMRFIANQANGAGPAAAAQTILRARRLDTATGTYNFPQSGDLAAQYTYTSNYQIGVNVPFQFSLVVPEGLNIVDAYSPVLLGPVADTRFKTSDALPCFSATLNDDYTLELPAGRRLVSLPQDGQVATANISYRSHWSQSGNLVSVHRELRAHFDKALCTGATLRETRDAMVRIHSDYETKVDITSGRAS